MIEGCGTLFVFQLNANKIKKTHNQRGYEKNTFKRKKKKEVEKISKCNWELLQPLPIKTYNSIINMFPIEGLEQ